ncbi:hypothetical protein WMY93_014925 [Mugilogobius chulae]|uniref:TGF-beta propeptide domain-containing protein n=1 Tax=Mugilogobius chulae TaxID=88201 RepID=A0AAW0P5P6_9GOBI
MEMEVTHYHFELQVVAAAPGHPPINLPPVNRVITVRDEPDVINLTESRLKLLWLQNHFSLDQLATLLNSLYTVKMSRRSFLNLFFNLLLLCLFPAHYHRQAEGHKIENKVILEMLHIDKITASVQSKPHPYMRRLFRRLGSLQGHDLDRTEGTVVQSVRMMNKVPDDTPHGWIWFNVTAAPPSVFASELVLFRKTLHPHPLNVTVTLHHLSLSRTVPHLSRPALEERPLSLDRRHSSGFDVFDVSDAVRSGGEMVGFKLSYRDESGGSLVLHDALTQRLYCLDRGALREPILVLYQSNLELN